LVIENKGDFKEFIPKWVKIHEYNAPTHVKEMLEKLTNVKLAKKDKLNVKVSKVYWKLVYIAYKVARKFLRKNIIYKAAFYKYKKNNIYNGYDAIIDFHGYGAYTTYLAAYMGKNVKRISWIHEQNIYMPYHLIAKCYKNFDHVFGCSKDCCDNFINVFPHAKDNVSVYYNYLDVDEIKKKATEKIDDNCLRKDNVFKIVSVGRVSEQKAFARVVDCAKILKDSGYQFY
jgi:glycosyltransferase involved in cell wall biosynthesis